MHSMDLFKKTHYSPYQVFTAAEWAEFRADTPLTLTLDEVKRLRSLNDPVDLDEVRRIYLALSRLLSTHVEALQSLYKQRKPFLMTKTIPLITRRSSTLAIPCDNGKYGSIRRICASDNQIRSLMATPPCAAIESGPQPSRNKFNRS